MTSTRYNQKSLMHDRQYGFFWYAWLWRALRPLLILTISLIIVMGMVSVGVGAVNNMFFAAPDPADTIVDQFVIERGDAVATVGENLFQQGFIKNKGIFRYLVQFRELTEKIQFGTYPLTRAMSVNDILNILAQGSATNERTITVIPGWRVQDIASYLYKQGTIKNEADFLALCNDGDKFKDNYSQIAEALDSGTAGKRFYLLEGYLAPDTFRIYSDANDQQIIETLLRQTEAVLDRVFNTDPEFEVTRDENGDIVDRDGNILDEPPPEYSTTLTRDQTIILASVIEKEAGTTADYRRVSAVLHNRLNKGTRLECDSTINYALGSSQLVLSGDQLQTDSPYNTYQNSGLPPGPICNPSERALIAALYPDMNYIHDGYMYFCSKDPATSNELQFSITKAEHEAAVAQYRPSWIAFQERQNAADQ